MQWSLTRRRELHSYLWEREWEAPPYHYNNQFNAVMLYIGWKCLLFNSVLIRRKRKKQDKIYGCESSTPTYYSHDVDCYINGKAILVNTMHPLISLNNHCFYWGENSLEFAGVSLSSGFPQCGRIKSEVIRGGNSNGGENEGTFIEQS